MIASSEAFDTVADAHDHARWALEQSPFDAAVSYDLAQRADDSDGAPALFLGCGSAREAQPFIDAGHQVVLVDYSPRMLELARQRYRQCPKVSYVLQSASDFLHAVTTDQFGLVSCVGELLCYVDDPAILMSRVRDLLNPGGVFVFTWVDRNALSSMARANSESLHPGSDVIIVHERDSPALTIAAWSQAHMGELLTSTGFALDTRVELVSSPRRYWTTAPRCCR